MAEDNQRLEQALRSAAAAGDDVAAQRIAQALRNRRATEDQPPAAPPLEKEEVDPFAAAPTEINGVKLSDDIREAIVLGQQIEDPKKKRMLAARIAGRVTAQDKSGNMADQIASGQFGAGLRGFGAGIFGIGDIAAAAGTTLRGIGDEEALSFGEALEAQREFRRAQEEEFPLTTGISEVGGALTGGGAIGAGIKTLKVGGKAGAVLSAATQFKKGQKLANVARASLLGATSGGVTEGLLEGDPSTGILVGAGAGPLGLGLVKAGSIGIGAVKSLLDDPAAAGIKVLAKKLGEKAEDLGKRFLQFKEITGKPPTLAELANPQAAAQLKELIGEQAAATAVAREGAETLTRTRAGEIAEQVTGSRVTSTQAAQKAARTKVAEKAFQAAENDPIKFTGEQVQDLLADPDLRAALPRTLKRRIDDILADVGEGAEATLSGLDVNDLRLALRDRARGATGADRVFGEIADEVEGIARAQSPAFAKAIDEFAERSLRGEGVAAGRKVTQAGTTKEFEQAVKAAADEPGTLAGQRVGARTALAETAREGAAKADTLVRALAEDSGLVQRLKSVLPEREINRLRELGQVQARAAEGIQGIAPGVRAEANNAVREAVRDAVGALVVSGGGTGGAFKAGIIQRALARITPGISEKVAKSIARDAFDPKKTEKVLSALRRAELSEQEILDLFASAATASGAAAQ